MLIECTRDHLYNQAGVQVFPLTHITSMLREKFLSRYNSVIKLVEFKTRVVIDWFEL